jgi:hypothetical protein
MEIVAEHDYHCKSSSSYDDTFTSASLTPRMQSSFSFNHLTQLLHPIRNLLNFRISIILCNRNQDWLACRSFMHALSTYQFIQ